MLFPNHIHHRQIVFNLMFVIIWIFFCLQGIAFFFVNVLSDSKVSKTFYLPQLLECCIHKNIDYSRNIMCNA